jgi:hypothetical protein
MIVCGKDFGSYRCYCALWVKAMGYGSLGTNADTMSAAKAAFQVIVSDDWDGAFLFLLKNGDRACHSTKPIFLADICINYDLIHCLVLLKVNLDLVGGGIYIETFSASVGNVSNSNHSP